tara:strand:- start:153 stop:491 length:339 start_codon:yes stop_codon:yes gene_type:complete
MSKETMKEMLEMIDAKIEHIEDISADNRAIIIKLVKQGNEIVKFLRSLEVENIETDTGGYSDISFYPEENDNKIDVKALLEEFIERREDFKELEKELKENKDMLTPGQVGEA